MANQPLFVWMCRDYVAIDCERLMELCAISACEHLLCIIRTILIRYYWSDVFGKTRATFCTTFCILYIFTLIIYRIIVKSEFKMNFFRFQTNKIPVAIVTAHEHSAQCSASIKIAPERITEIVIWANIFMKQFNFT